MPQADDQSTPTPPTGEPNEFDWPIGDLQPAIFDLRDTVGIFGHLILSASPVVHTPTFTAPPVG